MEQQVQIDPSKLSPADKQDLQQILSNEQQKIQVHQTVHHLTNVCWTKCIQGKVSRNTLEKNELSCAQNCVNRWMDANLAVISHLESLRGSQ
ncbi:hypothetical protein H112_04688 [Trichophyton rubrum D6]|uniref:Mitochondrial import inner membrane translocase subunit n=2 Tax=Trichophyton TaxID=5550 RepID=A0A022W1W8_TRIRU|nr:hypothetical protein H100_04696 [Trichophyton rubrum MR850]EZF41363.1 hypothetical protein H102_04684 [Trichophyton rubrum CBS 100081]EZF52284.1 hypothetical protein H103_04689 [Trichophyton rubrum CBS 288.86]EZF62776.1 hypothetical protein H104_04675 [Trichophyton rubrum CBS 289.86]EZF73405.1 hypothetical protein H105_04705 [Trichophyton soudanense CBS 452.61]EZF84090.1 hypothetical protein H110_04685 [Trichophyton rubrum MR1448]EZF94736.1 hypothetical protein H113_04723 [Trichophyton rub